MKSSNLFAMNERLGKLRFSLGLEWGELAEKLCISRSMLGFIRRGDKEASAKLLYRISELEDSLNSKTVATGSNDQWKSRALVAERKLGEVNEALSLILQGAKKLQEALK